MGNSILYSEKHVEAKLSEIGAQVARAAEMTLEFAELLRNVQADVAALYESLGEILGSG